jgi:hypothetical protein
VAIKADNMKEKHSNGKSADCGTAHCQYIYENCPDHRVELKAGAKKKGHFVDPLLKLYYQIPLMLVSNDDVPNGHANGTRVILEAVVLHEGHSTIETISFDGHKCPVVDASSVKHLICSLDGNPSKIFRIEPKSLTCRIKAPFPKNLLQFAPIKATINLTVSLTQFPIIVNCATTGHKLQGQTKHSLLIAVWSKVKNWNYVALSRVRTRQGLYLLTPLPYNTKFEVAPELTAMYAALRTLYPQADIPFNIATELAAFQQRQARHTTI